MPKIDIANLKVDVGGGYPQPYQVLFAGRSRRRLGNAAGLDQFGVDLTQLQRGSQSSMRHGHAAEDEFDFVREGEGRAVRERRREGAAGG